MRRFALIAFAAFVFTSSGALADADIGFKGAGGKLSFVSPDDIDATIGLGAIVDLGTIIPELGLQATLDFWSKSEDELGAEASFRDIVLGARTAYNFPVENPDFKPYVAGGLAIHIFHSEVDVPPLRDPFGNVIPGTGGTFDDTETKIGLDLAGGTGYAVADNADLIAEAMFRIVSDVSQFVISAGVVFWFE